MKMKVLSEGVCQNDYSDLIVYECLWWAAGSLSRIHTSLMVAITQTNCDRTSAIELFDYSVLTLVLGKKQTQINESIKID